MARLLSTDISRILAYLGSAIAILVTIIIGAHGSMFINLPSFLIVTVPAMGLMYARFGFSAFLLRRQTREVRNYYIDEWEKTLWQALGIAFIIGIIQILCNLEDPKNFGPPLALILLSFLYILIIRFFILEPLRDFKSITNNKALPKTAARAKSKLIGKTVVGTIILQFILLVGIVSVDHYILWPKKSAQYQKERKARSQKWESIAKDLNTKIGTSFSPDDVEYLNYFLAGEYSNFDIINKVYTSDEINREQLFDYLKKVEVKE